MKVMIRKHLLKKIAILFAIAGLAMGCTVQSSKNDDAGKEGIAVIDANGREVAVGDVRKAVIFDFGILDIMDTIGVDAELGIPVASLPSYLSKYADAKNMGSIKEPDLETIYEFEPDVIIISGRQEAFYDQLSEIAPTVYVTLDSAKYIDDFKRNAELVGTIFGKKEEAEKEIASIEKMIAETKTIADQMTEKALVILTNDGSVSAYGPGSRFGLIHDTLGVKPADPAIEVSTHGQEASFEYIAQIDPDILFVVDRTMIVGGSNEASDTLNNELVNGTKAAKQGRMIYLDPEAWYLAGGGIQSVKLMVQEVKDAISR